MGCGSTCSTAPRGRSTSCAMGRGRPRTWRGSWWTATGWTRGRRAPTSTTWSSCWSGWGSSPGAEGLGGGVGAAALVQQAQHLEPEVIELEGLHQAEVRPGVVHLLDVVLLREGGDGQHLDVPCPRVLPDG